MYLLDKIENLHKTARQTSVEFQFSDYLLNHIHDFHKFTLKEVSIDSEISASSILRFCKSAGFITYSSFIDALSKETTDLSLFLPSYDWLDIKQWELRDIKFQETCKKLNDSKICEFVDVLFNANKIMFYSKEKYLAPFNTLSRCLRYHYKKVYNSNIFDLDKANNTLKQFKENDCLIFISPDKTYNEFFELVIMSEDALKFSEYNVKTIFIGLAPSENTDIFIQIPNSEFDPSYISFFNYLDLRLLLEVDRRTK